MLDLHATLVPIGETTMNEITTEEEALASVRQDGWALKYVPEPLRDEVRSALKSGE
jgi:hypothetical protein